MKISKSIYGKFKKCNSLHEEIKKISDEIEAYLLGKGVDVDMIRHEDAGGYVDALDYGRGVPPKEMLEDLFSRFRIRK